ncbi:hypothetical protein niasHT_025630 [Heterodera trifolii]|uniref:Secreted protein n=1 Tax=Heterodera trifolii TaxID=157864 RepID=A0ABD2KHZ2_9BILA
MRFFSSPVPQMRLLLAPPCLRVLVATGQSSPPQSMERRRHSAPHGVHPRGAPPQKRMRRAHSSFSLANFLLCARLRALSAGPIARSVKNCENHGRDQLNDLIHDGQSQRNVAKTVFHAMGRCSSLSPFQTSTTTTLNSKGSRRRGGDGEPQQKQHESVLYDEGA